MNEPLTIKEKRPPDPEAMLIKAAASGYYDIQKQRISTDQRILAQLYAKLGLPPEIPEPRGEESPEKKKERLRRSEERNEIIYSFLVKLGIEPPKTDGKKKAPKVNFLDIVFKDYKNITDWAVKNNSRISRALENAGIGVISDESQMEMIKASHLLKDAEEQLLKPIKRLVEAHPVWINFLRDVRGVGPLMAAVMLSRFNIHIAKYPSSFHAFSGIDVTEVPLLDDNGDQVYDDNGLPVMVREGRNRTKAHQIETTYTDKSGEEKTKMGLSFDPFLKTKLVGVLGSSFLRTRDPVLDEDGRQVYDEEGKKLTKACHYGQVYYDYRNRLDNNPAHDDKTAAHKHAMANRYMIKMFLIDLHVVWRTIEGLEVSKPYHEAKLGMDPHSKPNPAVNKLLNEFKKAS